MEAQGMATGASVLPKACANCRIRKVRCNRVNPCSSCQTSGIPCRPSTGVHVPQRRARISASPARQMSSHDRQLEEIQDRLAGLEHAISRIAPKSPQVPSPPQASRHDSGNGLGVPSENTPSSSSGHTPYEGPSSFTTQVSSATQLVGLDPDEAAPQSDEATLSALQGVVEASSIPSGNADFYFDRSLAILQPQMQLLPATLVLKLLKIYKTNHSRILLASGLRDYGRLESLCQRAYFPTDPMSQGEVAILYGLLYLIMFECLISPENSELTREYDFDAFSKLCATNFHTSIQTYEVLVTPSSDNTGALLLAMVKAQEESKPLLCWTYTSAAARHCISLGYHRKASLRNRPPDQAEEIRRLFWSIYTFDKNLSLTLGRTPSFQDYDIDVEMMSVGADPSIALWDKADIAFVELSRLQGLTYERLFSLPAVTKGNQERVAMVNQLAVEYENWHQSWFKIVSENRQNCLHSEFFETIYTGVDVIYYALLSTLYRASSPPGSVLEITPDCYNSAYKSLQTHLTYLNFLRSRDTGALLPAYIGWTLFYTSYTPIVIVFLHAIASLVMEDVEMLERVSLSLEEIQNSYKEIYYSETMRLNSVCKIFSRVARTRIENASLKSTPQNPQDNTVFRHEDLQWVFDGTQMDSAPMAEIVQEGYPVPAMVDTDMSNFFANWMEGDQAAAGFLNMDFTQGQM